MSVTNQNWLLFWALPTSALIPFPMLTFTLNKESKL